MFNLKKLIIFGLVLLLGISVAMVGRDAKASEEQVVVRVNDVEITLSQFHEALEAQAGAQVLEQLIAEELLRQKQEEANVEVTDEQYEEFFGRLVMQVGGPQGLQQILMENRLTIEQLEENLRVNLLISELAKSEVEISDEEITEYFTENKEQLSQPEQVDASHILVETKEEADDIIAQLIQGADFAELATELSTDPSAASNGGRLGLFAKGQMVAPFEKAAFAAEVGDYVTAESEYGWHVILINDKVAYQEAQLEDVYDQIKDSLLSQKALAPGEYVQKLRQDSTVDVLLERYQK